MLFKKVFIIAIVVTLTDYTFSASKTSSRPPTAIPSLFARVLIHGYYDVNEGVADPNVTALMIAPSKKAPAHNPIVGFWSDGSDAFAALIRNTKNISTFNPKQRSAQPYVLYRNPFPRPLSVDNTRRSPIAFGPTDSENVLGCADILDLPSETPEAVIKFCDHEKPLELHLRVHNHNQTNGSSIFSWTVLEAEKPSNTRCSAVPEQKKNTDSDKK